MPRRHRHRPALHHLRQRRRRQEHADRPPAGRQQDRAAGPAGRRAARRRDRPGAADRRPLGRARAGHHHRRRLPLLLDRASASSSSATRRATSSTRATWSPPPRAPMPPWCWSMPPSCAWAAEVDDGEVVRRELLPQTRRHTLLCHLLRVQSIVFAVNKLDAIADAELAFERISDALANFAEAAGVQVAATVPISALKGWNVASRHAQLVRLRRPEPDRAAGRPAGHRAGRGRALRLPGAMGREVLRLGRHLARPPRVLGPRGQRPRGAGPAHHRAAEQPDAPPSPRCSATRASPRPCMRATAPASCWTASSTSRAATGCWHPTPSSRCARSPPPSPGSTTSRWSRAASTGRCRATAGSRPRWRASSIA